MINPISDGEPVTYELLNAIINQVNSIVVPSDDQAQIVKVYGNTIGRKEDDVVKIAVGSQEVNVTATGVVNDIKFNFPDGTNFQSSPYVTTSIIDYKGEGQGISIGSLTITSITNQNFTARLKLITDLKKATTVRVNYIAIGSGSTS
jgi:hypothetical protein